jgi:hypothetical protein
MQLFSLTTFRDASGRTFDKDPQAGRRDAYQDEEYTRILMRVAELAATDLRFAILQ